MDLEKIFKDKKVLLTGHTGFKGAWLLQILHHFGAIVKGISLPPEHDNDLYNQINGDELCHASVFGDICDADLVMREIARFEPDYVFHLAAQALVRKSYDTPLATFDTNVMGTVHVLEAMRYLQNPCIGIIITTDKVYENPETGDAFIEDDKLGGYDPYSASKAASEMVISSYQRSFFNKNDFEKHQKTIVAMRAGNVIGGGDYSDDRIIPDIVRAISFGTAVKLRNPDAVRPWQHVLEPLFAYLLMAAKCTEQPTSFAPAYNIGPEKADILDVKTVTEMFIEAFGHGAYEIEPHRPAQHEAQMLLLDNSKIKKDIGFSPQLNAQQAIQWTADWYANKEQSAWEKCAAQISTYASKIS